MGSSKSSSDSVIGCGILMAVVLVCSMVSACSGGDDGKADTASATEHSAASGVADGSPKPTRPKPKKVTLSLDEIVNTPGTFQQFQHFVAEHGTAHEKKAVEHLEKWRGFSRKAYPAIEVASDYPTVDYEADGATDEVMALEKESQYVAEAFAAWWRIDEPSVIQVFDRGGRYTAGTACIRADSAEKEGSCL
ncbi:hypothetical protein [Streptomyces sp. NPDC046870]|uniref:hypothetical protein n=1 Tax=Streptomyces sp. NPDC046870 TaxID=3155135 RepID=UPI00345417B1